MSLLDITGVFSMSCLLCVFHVSSQPVGCPSGWFGPLCNYKCRCPDSTCNSTGVCTLPSTCQSGWFGPECQYVDLAYQTRNEPLVVDNNDSTCITRPGHQTITITTGASFIFTWLRVVVAPPGSATIEDLTLRFFLNNNTVTCTNLWKQIEEVAFVDMHCNHTEDINKLTLTGESAGYICSVYVSGGRNVALKERTTQDSTYSEIVGNININFTSDKAVDGNTDGDFFRGLTCSATHHSSSSEYPLATWSLYLSKPRQINRYVLYNTAGTGAFRIRGFTLESFDLNNHTQFAYTDLAATVKPIYRISHSPLEVSMVVVTVRQSVHLVLCELEVYGDSICDHQHYGRRCELECRCPYGEPCFVSTGGCPLGCPPGFHGPGCSEKCSIGRFGRHCNSTCSQFCKLTVNTTVAQCHYATGSCFSGCQTGYTGLRCEWECIFGYFGDSCNLQCSPGCVESSNASISPCNHKTGACINGCQSGFTGISCLKQCTPGTFGDNCSSLCSPSCPETFDTEISPCHPSTGACVMECWSGFSGPTCENKCFIGHYGPNCRLLCSERCLAPGGANISSCDLETGACLMGCKPGFTGLTCASAKTWSSGGVGVKLIVCLCVATAAVVFTVFVFCKRKMTEPKGSVAPETAQSFVHNTWQPGDM